MINSGEDNIVNPQDSVVINPVYNQNKSANSKIMRKKNEFYNNFGAYCLIFTFGIIGIALCISNNNNR